jgi:crossover junction endodeoxyribonuclease RuvC
VYVLGVDPGLTRCGVAIIEQKQNLSDFKLIFAKAISTSTNDSHPRRLELIYDTLEQIFTEQQIERVSIERPFLTAHNPDTGLGTAQVAGIAMLLAQKFNKKIDIYNSKEVKLAVTGSGSASKEQIQKAVKMLLRLKDLPKPADAADALAIAISSCLRPKEGVGNQPFSNTGQLTKAQRIWISTQSKNKKNSRIM